MLDYRINTFLRVCELMNFTKAAKELSITQPAVSQHIHYLEELYDTKFFEFKGKKIELTNAGKLFYKTAKTMKNDETYLKDFIHQQTEGIKKLKFGATLTIGQFALPVKLNKFLISKPDIEIDMIVANTEELLSKLESGNIDFAILEGYFNKRDYDYEVFSLEDFICVSSNQSKIRSQVKSIEDLFEYKLIVREKGSGTRDILEKNLQGKNLLIHDFNQIMEIGNINVIKYLVEENHGITFIYETAVKEELDRGILKKIRIKDFKINHNFYFIWRKNSVFGDIFREIAKEFRI